MALIRRSQEIPKDAVIMNKDEAALYAWELIYKWKDMSDVWALRYGSTVLGGISAVSGVIINNFFRKKMKLSNYGYFASVIPLTVMPGLLTILFHRILISSDILLNQSNYCPICYEVRSTAIQLGLGACYPMVLAPTAAFMLANRYNTYRVPDLRDGPKKYYKFVRNVTRPFTGTFTLLSLIHVSASSTITYFEIKNAITLRSKLKEIEQKIDSGELPLES